MSLYVLRYGTERGDGAYVGVGTPKRQRDAARWIGRRAARRALAETRARGYDVRLIRLRPRRRLIGYVVRLEAPGEAPRWLGYGDQPTDRPRQRRYFRVASDASWRATGPHARVVPVYLRARGRR